MAKALFIHDGDAIDYRPTTNVAAGDVVVINDLVGVAKRDIPANTLGALAVTGVFEFGLEEPDGVAMGETVYWNSHDGWVMNDSDGGAALRIGVAVSPPYTKNSSTRILVRLNH